MQLLYTSHVKFLARTTNTYRCLQLGNERLICRTADSASDAPPLMTSQQDPLTLARIMQQARMKTREANMLKEVGASGQISLGKKYVGKLYDVICHPGDRFELSTR